MTAERISERWPTTHAATYLTRARVVVGDDIVDDAGVLVVEGHIAAVAPEGVRADVEVDLEGRLLVPGLIDLHCDALEKVVEPRPNVFFPLDLAVQEIDARNAAAGITTAFHALSFAANELGVRNIDVATDVVRAIREHASRAFVDHRVHCRYEITDASAMPALSALLGDRTVDLLSVMDHTPGQGQFAEVSTYRDFLVRTYAKSCEEAETLIQRKLDGRHGAHDRIASLAETARKHGIPIASHDDDSVRRVRTMRDFGVTISEFPVNLEAARTARAFGMATVFGAPNVIRGRSQSGALRAIDAVAAHVADCLCSDYAPATLLRAPFAVAKLTGLSLPQALRLVSANPANAAGLTDRGEVAVGKRADLVAVELHGDAPRAATVWNAGRPVFWSRFAATWA